MADNQPDSRVTPVTSHVLFLANGAKIKIDMHCAKCLEMQWTLNLEGLSDLNQLCAVFESVKPDTNTYLAMMFLRVGTVHWEMSIRMKSAARFRFGPQIAHSMGENRVVGYGSVEMLKDCAPESVTAVRVEFIKSRVPIKSIYYHWIACDFSKFVQQFATRGLMMENVNHKAPVEIFSLHSEYFCTLFFGENFLERSRDFINIKFINAQFVDLLQVILIPKTQHFVRSLSTESIPNLLRALDRFGCTVVFEKLKAFAKLKTKYLNMESEPFKFIIEVAEISGDNQILENYFKRFVLTDCLRTLVQSNVNTMTPTSTLLLTERMNMLSTEYCRRIRLRFIFVQGEVIVSLIGDPSSAPLQHLLQLIKENSAIGIITPFIDYRATFLVLSKPLRFTVPSPPILFASKPMLLHYIDNEGIFLLHREKPKLVFRNYDSYYTKKDPVLGVVMSGQEIIPNVTILRSISVVM